ncbi:MAG: ribonuclease H-like YkuK family protein [Chitinophagales bacterium]
MKKFKKYEGKYIENLPEYILNVISKYKDVKIHIGTDSQRHANNIHFATVIAFRYGTRGVHYIYQFKKMDLFRTIQTRLTHEIELTVNIVMWLKEFMPFLKIEALEADVNIDEKWESNKVYGLATGWLQGVAAPETKVLAKPELLVAIRAANHVV